MVCFFTPDGFFFHPSLEMKVFFFTPVWTGVKKKPFHSGPDWGEKKNHFAKAGVKKNTIQPDMSAETAEPAELSQLSRLS